MERAALPRLATTAIGSLPYTQLELAVQQAFLVDVPYLPQLPLRDPAEYMVPQALDGMPGLRFDRDGNATLDVDEWRKGWLDPRIERAIEKGQDLASFEPRPGACAAWRPFVWEIEQRKAPFAKVHLAGPLTLRWSLRTTGGQRLADLPDGAEIEAQILRLVLAKALAMTRRLREAGTTPIVFLDEPGLVAYDRTDGRHIVGLQETRVVILALQREGAYVGVHCCGNTEWGALLQLPWDLASLDVRLSLQKVIETGPAFAKFANAGGALALGIVPTNLLSAANEGRGEDQDAVVDALVAALPAQLEAAAPGLLDRCLLTPACGLAMRTVPDTEAALARLRRAQKVLLQR